MSMPLLALCHVAVSQKSLLCSVPSQLWGAQLHECVRDSEQVTMLRTQHLPDYMGNIKLHEVLTATSTCCALSHVCIVAHMLVAPLLLRIMQLHRQDKCPKVGVDPVGREQGAGARFCKDMKEIHMRVLPQSLCFSIEASVSCSSPKSMHYGFVLNVGLLHS